MNYYANLYDPNGGNETWEQFKITKIRPKKPSRIAKTPLETGAVSIDNKVIDPIEISVTGYLEERFYDSFMDFLNKWRENRKWEFLRLSSKFEIFDNLILLDITQEETAERFDVAEVTITLMKVLMENPQKKAFDPSNSDTQANGFVNGV